MTREILLELCENGAIIEYPLENCKVVVEGVPAKIYNRIAEDIRIATENGALEGRIKFKLVFDVEAVE